jgi:hypothetical protein
MNPANGRELKRGGMSSLGNYGTGIWVLNVPPGPTEVSAVSQGWILGSATIVTMPLTFVLLIADQIVPSSGS